MGRRRWKLYQDTLYSSSRSASITQPHHLHPPSLCQDLLPNQNNHQPVSAAATLQLRVKQEPHIQRCDDQEDQLEELKRQEDSRLRSEDIKVETADRDQNLEEDTELKINEDSAGGDSPLATETNESNIIDTEGIKVSVNKIIYLALREHRVTFVSFQEKTEEVALERIQVTKGLLRVKKEEELQEQPSSVLVASCQENLTTRSVTSAEKDTDIHNEKNLKPIPYLGIGIENRRSSPTPTDWKPLDKCYLCLDGKLPHDEQPPLVRRLLISSIHFGIVHFHDEFFHHFCSQSPQSESSSSSRSAESPMSVQVDPAMAASLAAVAALSGATGGAGGYPTLLPQWCLAPREAPRVSVTTHQENTSGVDQPLDLSAKPRNSQVK